MSSSQLIVKWINEADELLNQGDTVQASEKYYKAAEEAIKILAQKQGIKPKLKDGRWSSKELFRIVSILSKKDTRIYNIWISAWILHVDGFHEMKLTKELIVKYSKIVKGIMEYIQ